ncbi:hypothetical protein VSP10_12955 [Myroides odoratimimus]|uniref:hypothetical protein n=1 Tax=Myroides odoratimimus TaxID=76832 RepID=UPI002DB62363|nr:hypothetical protein [Myroides odoratimimus]MEC4053695.1 hypothetical protein [Myroides odoratimimus]
MMKRSVVVILLSLLGVFFSQCKDSKEVEQTIEVPTPSEQGSITPTEEEVEEKEVIYGTYAGKFPWTEEGEDMEILQVSAQIKEGNKYVYRVISSTGTHHEEGEWELEQDRLYLREDEYSAAHAFLVKEGKLYFLDSEGDVVNEHESGDYILVKK